MTTRNPVTVPAILRTHFSGFFFCQVLAHEGDDRFTVKLTHRTNRGGYAPGETLSARLDDICKRPLRTARGSGGKLYAIGYQLPDLLAALYECTPAECSRVWVTFTLDDLLGADDYDDDGEPTITGDTPEGTNELSRRATLAYEILRAAIAERYPNATDVDSQCTGWSDTGGGSYTPRADDGDSRHDPDFLDWMTEQCDALAEQVKPA